MLANFFKKDLCGLCKDNKAARHCLRRNKVICWHCCNKLRNDRKCPKECDYSLKNTKDRNKLFQTETKSDSMKEYNNLIKILLDQWLNKPFELTDKKTPLEAIKDKNELQKLKKFIDDIHFQLRKIENYIRDCLNLKLKDDGSNILTHEEVVEKFIKLVIQQKWEDLTQLMKNADKYKNEQFKEQFIKRISSIKVLKKAKDYELIASALNKKQNNGLIKLYINNKYDITFETVLENKKWKINNIIIGILELYNTMGRSFQAIGNAFSKGNLTNLYELLNKFTKVYPNSADIYYYWGMLRILEKKSKKALKNFLIAKEIDKTFEETNYYIAYCYHVMSEFDKAEQLYKKILGNDKDDKRVLNNLASIQIEKDNISEAKKLLNKALEIDPDFEMAKKNLERIK